MQYPQESPFRQHKGPIPKAPVREIDRNLQRVARFGVTAEHLEGAPCEMFAIFMNMKPPLAQQWLDNTQVKNRDPSDVTMSNYARIMKSMGWKTNGATIKIDPDGNILDGQQRLEACVRSGTSFWTMVAFLVPTDAFDTIDNGKRRSPGDVIGIVEENGNRLAATLQLLWRHIHRDMMDGPRMRAQTHELIKLLEKHPTMRAHVPRGRNLGLSPSNGAFLSYALTDHDPVKGPAFIDALRTGIGLPADSPILKLRNKLAAETAKRGSRLQKLPTLTKMAWAIKTYNAWINGRTIAHLSWRAIEEFPVIGGGKRATNGEDHPAG